MYLGYVLAIAGLALVFRSWLVIPMLGLSLAFVLNRIPREEKLLGERFGDEFEAYRHRTWKMVPYLY
jgi:protein-S-isoprenylcysteine O-methyltransferase Ste14